MNAADAVASNKTGYFVLSLDTEMAWGYFDCLHPGMFSPEGKCERAAIERLLRILDEFGIVATWALVGHLMYEECESCTVCPVMDWKGKYSSFEAVYGTKDPLWYAKDVVDSLTTRAIGHEIAFHGYTHRVFDDTMNIDGARLEVEEWLRVAERRNITPRAAVFPRNRVGHLGVFEQAEFLCYRGPQIMHPTYYVPVIGKILNRLDLLLQYLPPQIYELESEPGAMVNLPSSAWLFRIDRRIERILDAMNLHKWRLRGIVGAIQRAADDGKVLHLWAHPHEFRTEKDFEKLRHILGTVSEHVASGKLISIGMSALARIALDHRPEGVC